jgi:hypothetical protein
MGKVLSYLLPCRSFLCLFPSLAVAKKIPTRACILAELCFIECGSPKGSQKGDKAPYDQQHNAPIEFRTLPVRNRKRLLPLFGLLARFEPRPPPAAGQTSHPQSSSIWLILTLFNLIQCYLILNFFETRLVLSLNNNPFIAMNADLLFLRRRPAVNRKLTWLGRNPTLAQHVCCRN